MSRLFRMLACVVIVLTCLIVVPPDSTAASQSGDDQIIDLANIPLTTADLPESGYQVLAGGFLDRNATVDWIASPRLREASSAESNLMESGWISSYVLDLVLLEDRAFAGSDILAMVQTNVYLYVDEEGARIALEWMSDYGANESAEVLEPVINGGTTLHLVTESGDTMRSLVQFDRLVIEVVTFEAFRMVEPENHHLTVVDTYDRLVAVHDASSTSIAPRAVQIRDGDDVANLMNVQQTGVHQVYRLRDDNVMPAAGELNAPAGDVLGQGLVTLYQASQTVQIGQGAGFYSSWIGEFSSSDDAGAFVAALPESSDNALLPDPYFTAWENESTTSQSVVGLFRVTGQIGDQLFSGTIEVRQQDNYVIGIGWRTVGNSLPSVDVTSRLMDAQLACLEMIDFCPPISVGELIPAEQDQEQVEEQATPIIPMSGGTFQSEEFGWSLSMDVSEWSVNEQFTESGYDFLELQSGQSLVTLESVIDQHGDPQQCVLDELNALRSREEQAAINLGSDVADEQPAGSGPGYAWSIYMVEPLAAERADQEYTIRIDCYTLIDGGASLILTHRAPRYLWAQDSVKGDELRANLHLPIARVSGDTLVLDRWNRRFDMDTLYWMETAA